MYYPILRGKQYELKAIREYAEEIQGAGHIVPIIEPVKSSVSALCLAIEAMSSNKQVFALILNPDEGDYKFNASIFNAFEGELGNLLDKSYFIPAFNYRQSEGAEIIRTIENRKLSDVMILCRSGILPDDPNLLQLIGSPLTKYFVYTPESTPRNIKRTLNNSGKKAITLRDCFRKVNSNFEYTTNIDEMFSEEMFFYRSEGFYGFSDYTTLSSGYTEGGVTPKTLAIHFTYRRTEEQIFVHHFTSDSNDSIADIKGKFREAAMKVEPFYRQRNVNPTPPVVDIINRSEDPDGYPGLGYLKKVSIKNHFYLIDTTLSEQDRDADQ